MSKFGSTIYVTKNSTEANKTPWRCVAITLDPEGTRYQKFLANNRHLQIESFKGIKGSDLSKKEIIKQGLATRELTYSPFLGNGTIGCAASHKAIWDKAAEGKQGYVVLEDDCYTHPKIANFIDKKLITLMKIDICFFGINTDSILQCISQTGLARLSLFEPRYPSPEWIKKALSRTDTKTVELHKLMKAFGNCAYFISPKGARKLSTKLFPMSFRTTNIPLVTEKMPAIGLDRAGNGIYSKLEAYVCQPFLAYTPNIDSSTRP